MSQKQIETTKIENIFTDTFDYFSSVLKWCEKTYLENLFVRVKLSISRGVIEGIFCIQLVGNASQAIYPLAIFMSLKQYPKI